ncbi:RcnB family protein [Rhodanobacter ginsengisoli]|uniref:RcnB family protein n=1 Tax=Rhodanobacter ginsengisoli TaxID=418646 RepID=A0ABW0QQH7_9GAMM
MKKQMKVWMVCGAMLLTASVAASAQPMGQDHHGQDQGDHGKHGDKHSDRRGHDGGGDHSSRDRGDHDRGYSERDNRHHGDRDHGYGYRDRGYRDHDRRYYGHGHAYAYGHDRGHRGMYDRGREEGWYRRGGYVPVEYRRGSYVVNDWRDEHLRRPRRGYHWVRSDNGDFLLVAITTGVIVDLLLHH